MKTRIRNIFIGLSALMAAAAPGITMAVERKLRPDAVDFGGYLHQLIGRTFNSSRTDVLSLALVFALLVWLMNRTLFRPSRNTGIGEYLLCGFFAVMQVFVSLHKDAGSVNALMENAFQLVKAAVKGLGMYLLFLAGERGITMILLTKTRPGDFPRLGKHPFRIPFFVLLAVWLPQLIIKYPGGLTIETICQYMEYIGEWGHGRPHPAFGAVIYGNLIRWALASGHPNEVYFAFTLVKSLIFIAVLAYALQVMLRLRVPFWVYALSFGLFALCPVYVGWTTNISKDSSYLILFLAISIFILEWIANPQVFLRSNVKMILLGLCLVLLMLVRHNGATVAIPLLLMLVIQTFAARYDRVRKLRIIALALAVAAVTLGTETALMASRGIKPTKMDEVLSLFVQTSACAATRHGDEMPEDEADVLRRIYDFDHISKYYVPDCSDDVRLTAPADRTTADLIPFIGVWLKQMVRYPAAYMDGALALNGVLFDIGGNTPYYTSLSDNSLYDYVYPHSFNDMAYYDADQLRPLHSLQRALTEWYYRFDDLPGIGLLASMGFCFIACVFMTWLCVAHGRSRALFVLIPSLIMGINGVFSPIVYLRYLVPMVAALPLWLAAWYLSPATKPVSVPFRMKSDSLRKESAL